MACKALPTKSPTTGPPATGPRGAIPKTQHKPHPRHHQKQVVRRGANAGTEEFQTFLKRQIFKISNFPARNCSSQKTGVKTGRISASTGAVSREPWQCLKCTYANKAEAVSCEMCQNFRGAPAASLNIEGRLVEKPSRFSEHKYMPPNAADLVNNSDHSPSEVSTKQIIQVEIM